MLLFKNTTASLKTEKSDQPFRRTFSSSVFTVSEINRDYLIFQQVKTVTE